MGNVIAAIIAVIGFLAGMALIGVSFAFPDPLLPIMFIGGILVISLAVGLPPWLLDKLDG
jgi:hypothetical protein